ncbi:MAG: MFS transporter [Clostridia bacterium]|nr:MFS transporter [Clostridia bacterium]
MKLNYKRTILIGFAFMAILAFWQFYDQVIPYVLEEKFKLDTPVANAFMAADNVLAVFMLPLFGKLSDKTHTKLGKRTPYILYGTIGSVILLCVLAYFESKVDFWGFIITLMALLVVMATYRSPAVAYMPDVTEKPLRSKGNAIINLVGYVGGIFATILMMFMLKSETVIVNGEEKKIYASNQSFTPVFLIIAGFMLVSVLIMVLTVKENKVLAETNIKDEEEETSGKGAKLSKPVVVSLVLILLSVFLWYTAYNGVTTTFSRYCIKIWNIDLGASSMFLTVATVAAIAAFVPLGFLSSKIGRKKAVLFGIVLMTICYTVAIFVDAKTATQNPWIMYVMFGIIGIGWASINVNSFPMVVEMCTGSDVGKYTGYYYTFSMAAQIVTPLLSGMLIKWWGYEVLFPYAVIFSVASFVTMCFVRHGDSRPDSKKAIAEQFAADN